MFAHVLQFTRAILQSLPRVSLIQCTETSTRKSCQIVCSTQNLSDAAFKTNRINGDIRNANAQKMHFADH